MRDQTRHPLPLRPLAAPSVPRRRFLGFALLGGLGIATVGAVAGVVDFLFPRDEWGALRRTPVGTVDDYPPGRPPQRFADGRGARSLMPLRPWSAGGFFVVRLDLSQVDSGGQEGFVALADYCTHLGCSLPWRPDFRFDNRRGWFRCPCHGSTFTRAGARIFGPAPRGMDSYRVTIDADGQIFVDRMTVVPGDGGAPTQATPLLDSARG